MPGINPNTVIVINPTHPGSLPSLLVGSRENPVVQHVPEVEAVPLVPVMPLQLLALEQRALSQRISRRRTTESLMTAGALTLGGAAATIGTALYNMEPNAAITETPITSVALTVTSAILMAGSYHLHQAGMQRWHRLGEQEIQLQQLMRTASEFPNNPELVLNQLTNLGITEPIPQQTPVTPVPIEEMVIDVEPGDDNARSMSPSL